MQIETVDLNFLESEEVIASYLLVGGGSVAIVETGPTTCLGALKRGLSERNIAPEDVTGVFLTHIHLDHAGASGHVAEFLPNATFYVHEVGYPHLVDPSKLLKSAARLYGDRMDELWGETRPVPEDRVVALKGDGEEIEAAGGRLTAHDTPGHAYHHLAFMDPESRSLFAGDVAGIRLPGRSYVRPPTMPPETDMAAWSESIRKIRDLGPDSIYPTHFGGHTDVSRHLDELEVRLDEWLSFVEGEMDAGRDREEIAAALKERGDGEMLEEGTVGDGEQYDLAGNYEMLTDGIIRYVTRQRRSEEG